MTVHNCTIQYSTELTDNPPLILQTIISAQMLSVAVYMQLGSLLEQVEEETDGKLANPASPGKRLLKHR